MDKRTKNLLKALDAQGWRVKRTKNGYMAYPPDKSQDPVSIHLTYSDRRAWNNQTAELRRNGFNV